MGERKSRRRGKELLYLILWFTCYYNIGLKNILKKSIPFNRILTRVKSARGGSTSADWRSSLHDCDIKPKVYFVSQHKPGHQWRRQKSSGSWRKTGVESDWVLWDENILNVQRKLWEPLDNKLKHESIKAWITNKGNKIIKYEILEKRRRMKRGETAVTHRPVKIF